MPHAIEPELLQPVPRCVRRRGGRVDTCVLWLGRLAFLPHALVGLYLVSLAGGLTVAAVGRLLTGSAAARAAAGAGGLRDEPLAVVWAVAAFWNGVVGVPVWHLVGRGGRHARLVRAGTPAVATVTRVDPPRFWRAGRDRVEYEYAAPGLPDPVRSAYGSKRSFQFAHWLRPGLGGLVHTYSGLDLGVGDTFTVVYDPARPCRHVAYHVAEYLAVPTTTA